MPPERSIHVEIAGAPGELDGLATLSLPAGASVADALAALSLDVSEIEGLGIWGRRTTPDVILEDGDRLECYRPLQVDPKAARRARASARR